MIKKLNNSSLKTAEDIRFVFQVSYAIEAEILKATDFPPLKRPIESFLDCKNEFYGYLKGNEIAAVIELDIDKKVVHIQSLVVKPKFFRQGIASELLSFVFGNSKLELFTIETGVDNAPAVRLYKKHGFVEMRQWNTDYGVRKVRFERRNTV